MYEIVNRCKIRKKLFPICVVCADTKQQQIFPICVRQGLSKKSFDKGRSLSVKWLYLCFEKDESYGKKGCI